MTYPLIGNYGVCFDDMEADRPWNMGFIVREIAKVPSNFRSVESIGKFLTDNDITGIEAIDTRALTKILREKGTMRGMITTNENYDLGDCLARIKAWNMGHVVLDVTCKEKEVYPGEGYKVAVVDLGVKKNIVKSLLERGCQVTVYPAETDAEEILADKPDGIMLTNGPGDPKDNVKTIAEIKKLFDTDVPIFAICLGHQLLALANGADTEKMKYGHRGANHPVKDLKTGKCYISTQNHGYVVKEDTVDRDIAEVSYINVNDGTVEGLHYLGKNVQTVQFHPEACAGPLDTGYLFDQFMNMMEVSK
jgi:carbamoyl-phosphate synthase small subunit